MINFSEILFKKLDKYNPIKVVTGMAILCVILGFALGICAASFEYVCRIKPYSVSGSDLRIIPVFRGNEILDVWVPEKMRSLTDDRDIIEIPADTPDDLINHVTDQKLDSLQSVNGRFYSIIQI